jgi:hypothetical protein
MVAQLYRQFDAAGELLYVGISRSAMARLGQHLSVSPWAEYITTVKIETLPSREEALAAERVAIQTEHPKFNIKHNKPPKPFKLFKPFELPKSPEALKPWMRIAEAETEIIRTVTTLKAVYDEVSAASVLGISTANVKKLIASGEIGFVEIPKQRALGVNIRITGWQILEYLENQMKKVEPSAP